MSPYTFEWDAQKEASNIKKHGITFDQAKHVFSDPMALTIFDPDSSSIDEDRWVTIGQSDGHFYLVVVHTYNNDNNAVRVRLISARAATKHEVNYYERGYVTMREDYDFSNGERGKFYQHNAVVNTPIYLDHEVEEYLAAKADDEGLNLNQIVNNLLKQTMESAEQQRSQNLR